MATDPAGSSRIMRFLGGIAILVGLSIVIQNALVRSSLRGDGGRSLLTDPQLDMRRAMLSIAAASQDGNPTAEQVADAVDVARSAPLFPEPFLVAAIANDQQGNFRRAEELYLAARVRNPRLPIVRYLLGDHYRQAGKDGEALGELVALSRVQPQRQLALMPYFAKLAADAQYQPIIRQVMLADPGYGRQLLAAAVHEGASPVFVLHVGRQLPPHPDNRGWQEALIARAIARGDYGLAKRYLLAMGFGTSGNQLLAAARFDDSASPAPFRWALAQSPEGVAEPRAGDKLSLLYYGRNPLVMASRTVVIPDGRYRLQWISRQNDPNDPAVGWRLTCLPSSTVVGETKLSARSMTFSIPAACQAQRLELVAVPGAMRTRQSAEISALRLERMP